MTPKTFTLSMTIGLSEARMMVKALEALEPKTSSQEWSRRDLITLINHQINKARGGIKWISVHLKEILSA